MCVVDVVVSSFKDGSDDGCCRDRTDIPEFGGGRGFESVASRHYASEEGLGKCSAVHLVKRTSVVRVEGAYDPSVVVEGDGS